MKGYVCMILYEDIGSLMLIMKADESRKVHMKETSVWRKTVSEKTQKHVLSFSGFYQQRCHRFTSDLDR